MGSQGAATQREAMREERMIVANSAGSRAGVQSAVAAFTAGHQDQAQVFARYSAAGTVELRCGGGSKRLCVHLRALGSGVFMV